MTDIPPTTTDEKVAALRLVFEALSEEGYGLIEENLSGHGEDSLIVRIFFAIRDALRREDWLNTRVVFTGNMTASVDARKVRASTPYTRDRGSGTVAAKTMPPNEEGLVDILVPAEFALGEPTSEHQRIFLHVAAHEAIHASLFHDGKTPFDVQTRRAYDPALFQFASMASQHVEEHLAEYLSNRTMSAADGSTSEEVLAAFAAWNRTLEERLPAVAESDPEYYAKCMEITLTALNVLWTALAYLAAELRDGDSFLSVPEGIAALPEWQREVAPWWEEYVGLLAQIPMTVQVDVVSTDEIVDQIARLLQRWGKAIGVDHHDTPDGPWFQMTRPL